MANLKIKKAVELGPYHRLEIINFLTEKFLTNIWHLIYSTVIQSYWMCMWLYDAAAQYNYAWYYIHSGRLTGRPGLLSRAPALSARNLARPRPLTFGLMLEVIPLFSNPPTATPLPMLVKDCIFVAVGAGLVAPPILLGHVVDREVSDDCDTCRSRARLAALPRLLVLGIGTAICLGFRGLAAESSE